MMNDNYKHWSFFSILLLSLISVAVFLCAYYFPTSRDDFFYYKTFGINVFEEYKIAYYEGNPRIGQFFTNLVMRDVFMKSFYAIILFFSFFAVIFLNVFRRLPSIKSISDVCTLVGMMGIFSFLIYVFGEMFFYSSFSGNYTLSVVFYMLFLYFITDYYIYDKNHFSGSKWSIPFIFIVGIYTGMCNEHVPPVLISLSFLASLVYFIKNKRLPNYKIFLYQFMLIVGYLLLFFAPANNVKYKSLGKEHETFSLVTYFKNFVNVLNYFRYFTPELVFIFGICLLAVILLFIKKKVNLKTFLLIMSYSLVGILTIAIVSYAPLSGTRLVFFTNTMFIMVIFFTIFQVNNERIIFKVINVLGGLVLLVLLGSGIIIYKNALQNFKTVTKIIEEESKKNKNVVLKTNFNYYHPYFGIYNRRFLLDRGNEYINNDPSTDNSAELVLKNYYHLQSISVQP